MTKVKCRFCGHTRPTSYMFHWHSDVWECLDLVGCERSEAIRLATKEPDHGAR